VFVDKFVFSSVEMFRKNKEFSNAFKQKTVKMLSKFRYSSRVTFTTITPRLITAQRFFFFSSWKNKTATQKPAVAAEAQKENTVVVKTQPPKQEQKNVVDDDDDDPVSFLMNNNNQPQSDETKEPKSDSKRQPEGSKTPEQLIKEQQQVPPQLHAVGIDPAEQLGQPGSVRLEVQITVMTGRMNAFEKKLDDHSTILAKIEAESRILRLKKESKDIQKKEFDEIEKKLEKFESDKIYSAKVVASSAAAWMSTALTLSSLLEAEEGHRMEMKIILQQILEKLDKKKEFKALNKNVVNFPKSKQQMQAEAEEEGDFFSSHEESIRVATLVRLARVEHDLGNFSEALVASQKAIDKIIRCCPKDEKENNNKVNNVDLILVQNSAIRYQWLLLCKLHATTLAALNKTTQEQDFLKNKILKVSKSIDEWKILNADGKIIEFPVVENKEASKTDVVSVTAIIQEINTFVELLMRYADSLGLEEGGGGWKKPQDPVFVEKRKSCEHLVEKFLPLLGKVHPVMLQARACLALDCGSVAVSRQETILVMKSLIDDAENFLKEKEVQETSEGELAKKTGFTDVMGTTNEDLFALRTALLLWKRKLALAYADLKQFADSLKLLEETSAKCDQVLGVSHRDSITTLRCLVRVTFVSGDQVKAKQLNDKLIAREKPASI
jgi:hypothetical protein